MIVTIAICVTVAVCTFFISRASISITIKRVGEDAPVVDVPDIDTVYENVEKDTEKVPNFADVIAVINKDFGGLGDE